MPVSAYLVVGDEYQVSAKARELVASLVPPEDQALGLETVDGRVDNAEQAVLAIRRCIEGVTTIGMFGGRKVIWFRDVNFLSSTAEIVKARLGDLAERVKKGFPEGNLLILSATEADKRFSVYKAFKDKGQIHEFAVPEKDYEIEKFARAKLDGILQAAGVTMTPGAREAFLDKVGGDMRQIANEVEKLAVYAGKKTVIEGADVEAVTCSTRQSLAWDLTDAFGHRDLKKALSVLRRLIGQGESAIGLIIQLEGRIRDLILYRQALDERWLVLSGRGASWGSIPPAGDAALKQFERDPRSTHPYRVGLLAAQAEKHRLPRLINCQRAAMETHEKMILSPVEDDILLELFLIRALG